MLNKTESINLSHSPAGLSTVRIKVNITKAKYRLAQKKRPSTRRLAAELNISRMSAQRV